MSYGSLKKNWSNLGFRGRLTTGLILLFAIIISIGYWALYLEFQKEMELEFNSSLYNYATDLIQRIEFRPNGQANLSSEVIISAEKIFPFPHGDALVKIIGFPFNSLFTFSNDHDSPRDLATLQRAMKDLPSKKFLDLAAPSGQNWRGLAIPLKTKTREKICFFVAVPLARLSMQETRLRSIFIMSHLLILTLCAVMISILSKSLLKTLEQLTNQVRELAIDKPNLIFETPGGPPEINLLAQRLNQFQTRIYQSLSAHQEFVAQAAHQLKTPLTIAFGHLEEMKNPEIDEKARRERVNVALHEIDFMASTIDNLLNLVQIEAGHQKVEKKQCDLLELILDSVARMDALSKRNGIKFQIQCVPETDKEQTWNIGTDSHLLNIILGNIFENALKYAVQSPIWVVLEQLNGINRLEIKNIQQATSKKFEGTPLKAKFRRGHTSIPGQGLGLYIADKLAAILDIDLKVFTATNEFIVELVFQGENEWKSSQYPSPEIIN